MAKRDSFLLRMPPEVLDALRRWADEELRSVNSQIELLLSDALKQKGRFPKRVKEDARSNSEESDKRQEERGG